MAAEDLYWFLTNMYFDPLGEYEPSDFLDYFDADQRRTRRIYCSMDQFPYYEGLEYGVIMRHNDNLAESVHSYAVDKNGFLTQVFSDEKSDPTPYVPYPRFADCESLADCRTIKYSQLTELDRLSPRADKCSYTDEAGEVQAVVFKYNCLYTTEMRDQNWYEMHVLKHLEAHPHVLSLDRVVIEDIESRVIGFTTPFMPGGTLVDLPKDEPFLFKWLEQLTSVVDFLNLELGIRHQDIDARNILLHEGNILLFDFDQVSCRADHWRPYHDVQTVYTFLFSYLSSRRVYRVKDITDLQSMPEWPVGRKLDREMSDFRKHMDEWIEKRGGVEAACNETKIRSKIAWPKVQEAKDLPWPDQLTKDGWFTYVPRAGYATRYEAIKKGQYVFRWERPAKRRAPVTWKRYDEQFMDKYPDLTEAKMMRAHAERCDVEEREKDEKENAQREKEEKGELEREKDDKAKQQPEKGEREREKDDKAKQQPEKGLSAREQRAKRRRQSSGDSRALPAHPSQR